MESNASRERIAPIAAFAAQALHHVAIAFDVGLHVSNYHAEIVAAGPAVYYPLGEDDLPSDIASALVDLARAGREADFRWLAASAGVSDDALDALWTGTRTRVNGSDG